MTLTTEADKDFLQQLQQEADENKEDAMFYVISSTRRENGTLEWSRSIGLGPADARALAKQLVIATGRIVEVVRVCETFNPIPACGGCEYLEEGTCEGKEQTCEKFKRFK